MLRHFFVTVVVALVTLLPGCSEPAPEVSKQRNEPWSPERLQTLQRFRTEPAQRATLADDVARAFPTAFDESAGLDQAKMASAPSEARLIELLGQPNVSFSLIERPEHLGGVAARQLDLDPRQLHVLLYDVGCMIAPVPASDTDLCPYIEVLSLAQSVLRVRVIQDQRVDARKLLTPRPPEPKRQLLNHLDVTRPGWNKLEAPQADELSKRLPEPTLGHVFYQLGSGDAVYGRLLMPLRLTQVSSSEGVCVATIRDVIIPSSSQPVARAELYKETDAAIVVFATSVATCEQHYRAGQFINFRGEKLSPYQLLRINDLFARRFAAECDIPARRVPRGLVQATSGLYSIEVQAPEWVTNKWSTDAAIVFSLSLHETYIATVALRPWGVWIKECSKGPAR